MNKAFTFLLIIILFTGCQRLFGWSIYAPSQLSDNYYKRVPTLMHRIGLHLSPEALTFKSTERGSRFSDPQTYYVGEAFTAMSIEAFQHAFNELIVIDPKPTKELLIQYDIEYLVVLFVNDFHNKVTLKKQVLALQTEAWVFNQELSPIARIGADGKSDGDNIFYKSGGPELKLNLTIENNLTALITFLQDYIRNQ